MRFYYLDPGLTGNGGHHANSCREIVRAAQDCGVDVVILAHKSIEASIKEELAAQPFFDWYTYHKFRKSRVLSIFDRRTYQAGASLYGPLAPFTSRTYGLGKWLKSFHAAVESTYLDLKKASFQPSDIIYVNSAQSVQFAAFLRYMSDLPGSRRPQVFLEFGVHFGAARSSSKIGTPVRLAHPSINPSGAFYLIALAYWPEELGPLPIVCATFDPVASDAYSVLLKKPVAVLPLPRLALTDFPSREGKSIITIGVMGSQRSDKGYSLVPEVVRHILAQYQGVEFLLHSSFPDAMPDEQQELRAMAATDKRIRIEEGPADQSAWKRLLGSTDLMLCPYDPNRYRMSYSAVAAEAIAEGIPYIAPADTSLSVLAEQEAGACVTFSGWNAKSVAEATQRAIDDFQVLARQAHEAAIEWQNHHGAQALVTKMIEIARSNSVDHSSQADHV